MVKIYPQGTFNGSNAEQNITDETSFGDDVTVAFEVINVTSTVSSFEGNVTTNNTDATVVDYLPSSYVDLVLFVLFMLVWMTSVLYFFSRWNSVRLMSPVSGEARYRYAPRNLDTITVVKTHKESVIYSKKV